jgi:hypothetical protein
MGNHLTLDDLKELERNILKLSVITNLKDETLSDVLWTIDKHRKGLEFAYNLINNSIESD